MSMTTAVNKGSGWSALVVRPSVAVAIPWVGVCALVAILQITITELPAPGEVGRVLSTTHYGWVTAVNVALFVALAFDGWKVRRGPPDLRRTQLTTVVLAMALLAMLQVGAGLAVRPL